MLSQSIRQAKGMPWDLRHGTRKQVEMMERLRTSNSCMRILSVTPRTSAADQGSSKLYMLFRKSAMEEQSAISSADMSSEPWKHLRTRPFTTAIMSAPATFRVPSNYIMRPFGGIQEPVGS